MKSSPFNRTDRRANSPPWREKQTWAVTPENDPTVITTSVSSGCGATRIGRHCAVLSWRLKGRLFWKEDELYLLYAPQVHFDIGKQQRGPAPNTASRSNVHLFLLYILYTSNVFSERMKCDKYSLCVFFNLFFQIQNIYQWTFCLRCRFTKQ